MTISDVLRNFLRHVHPEESNRFLEQLSRAEAELPKFIVDLYNARMDVALPKRVHYFPTLAQLTTKDYEQWPTLLVASSGRTHEVVEVGNAVLVTAGGEIASRLYCGVLGGTYKIIEPHGSVEEQIPLPRSLR